MKQSRIITALFSLALLFCAQTAIAQNRQSSTRDADVDAAIKLSGKGYLDRNYKLTKSLGGIILGTKSIPVNAPDKATGKMEVINFGGNGNTILLTLDVTENGKGSMTLTYSWSGKDVHLVPSYEGGTPNFTVMRGRTPCGGLFKTQGKWMANVQAEENMKTISNLKRGMTPAEVESVFSDLGGSQFKFTGNSGNLKVYSLLWLRNVKRYNPSHTDYKYALRNDEKYADFYFDAQDKLVKWLFY